MTADDLSAALWQERRQLELLSFRMETQRLHMVAGNFQWLPFTSMEIQSTLDRLRLEALARAGESAAVAVDWGLLPEAGLVELAATAPAGPWAEILQEHVNELRRILRQLRQAARTNEEVLERLRAPEAAGMHLVEPPDTAGALSAAPGAAASLDQLTSEGNVDYALAVVRRAQQSLLSAYVGDTQE